MREPAAGGTPAITGEAAAGEGLPGSGAGGAAAAATSERTAYEKELARALASDEIHPWIAERIIGEEVLRAAATGEEAVRDAHAAAAEERARLRLLADRIERLDERLAGYTPRGTWIFVSLTLVVGAATALTWLTGTHPAAGVILGFLTAACLSGLLSRFTGVVVPRSGAGYGEYLQAREMTESNQRAIAVRQELRREARAARADRDAAEAAWRNALRERGILPRLRLAVNTALVGGESTTLVVRDRKALGGPPDPARLVDTTAAPRLRRLMEEMPGGTIAVGGPRGVGKTTLLHAVCAGRYNRPDEPADLAVSLAAPVRYVPREFVLNLFAATCQAVLADRGHAPVRPASDRPGEADRERLLLDLDRARRELDGLCADHPRDVYGRLAAEATPDGVRDRERERDRDRDETWTCRESIAARACLHLTVAELFAAWSEDGFATEGWAPDVDELAALARACDTEPALARHRLDDLRRHHGLMPVTRPADDEAGPPEAGRAGGTALPG